ncbi:hypothetical protein [Frigoribacterium faeni]|nr:hypothetical protein [Frigoribacterium faeni]
MYKRQLPPTVDAVARSLDEARRELAEAERARAGRNDELAALRLSLIHI